MALWPVRHGVLLDAAGPPRAPRIQSAYWLATQTARDLEESAEPRISNDIGGRKYDVFGTANFFNFTAWTAAIGVLEDAGWDRVAKYSQALVSDLIEGLDDTAYEILSPRDGAARSTLVFISHREAHRNRSIANRLKKDAGIYVALRQGRLRVSPHVHNSPDDISRLLEALRTT